MPSCRFRQSRPRTRIVLDLLEHTGVLVHPGYFFDFEREAFLVISLLPEPGQFASAASGALRPDGRGPMIPLSRRAGITVPLFSLRSTRSWGIGEIGDIPAFAEWLRAGESVGHADPAAERAGAVGVVAVLGAQRDGD